MVQAFPGHPRFARQLTDMGVWFQEKNGQGHLSKPAGVQLLAQVLFHWHSSDLCPG